MGLNNILCELYLLKELEDKNKNLYKFKYKYSNNLTDQEKQLYILERQKVYNNVFVFSYQLSSFVKAITEFATFNTYIIAVCLVKIKDYICNNKYFAYPSLILVPKIKEHYNNLNNVNEYIKKIEVVIASCDDKNRPKHLNWFKEYNPDDYRKNGFNFANYATNVKPMIPKVFDCSGLILGDSDNYCITIPDKVVFYTYNGCEFCENYYGFSDIEKLFIDELISYRFEKGLYSISDTDISRFCDNFIEEKIIKSNNNAKKLVRHQ